MVEILTCTVEYIGFGAVAELLMGVVSCCVCWWEREAGVLLCLLMGEGGAWKVSYLDMSFI